MSDKTCPKCGTPMVERVSTMLGGDASPHYCPVLPDQCRTRELERLLEAEQTAHAEDLRILNRDWKEKCIEADTLRKHLENATVELAATRKALEEADRALIEAVEHLEYCGYGDSWERECARDSGMIKRMDAAGALALTRQAQRKEKP